MPNCDFFAAGNDHRAILEYVVEQPECRVFELSSEFEKPLREFHELADFEDHYGITNWSDVAQPHMLLQIYPVMARGKFVKRRIKLDPKHCDGATFRFESAGWGLIQLYLEKPWNDYLQESHTNHNSEKRALAWEDINRDLGPVSAWDWAEVTKFSRRLNRFIQKLAVDKFHSRCILPHAAELEKSGMPLGHPEGRSFFL